MIDVSIVVAVYNHEKYIKQALDSILMQKTNFNYEVLIGEDCSTDHTREVLRSIEKDLPDNFHIFYRKKNYGPINNFKDLYSRTKGRYFIVLEGDDYWTYQYKLQKEYDYLETHPDYLCVAHNTLVVNDNNQAIPIDYPECKESEYTFNQFMEGLLPGQTTTKLIRNYYRYDIVKNHELDVGNYPGDRRESFLLCVNGKVHCIQQKWSAYRFVVSKGSSYSANSSYSREEELYYWKQLYSYLIDNFPNDDDKLQKVGDKFYWNLIVFCIKNRSKFYKYFKIEEYRKLPSKAKLILYILSKLVYYPIRKIRRQKYIAKIRKVQSFD